MAENGYAAEGCDATEALLLAKAGKPPVRICLTASSTKKWVF